MSSPVLFCIMLLIVAVVSKEFSGTLLRNFVTKRNTFISSKREARNAVLSDNDLWPNGRVPYTFEKENKFSSSDKLVLEKAMREIERSTCIRFVKKTDNDSDYIEFYPEGTCTSPVGRIGGSQRITLGKNCLIDIQTAVHEMMHALGFYHEQSRQDRDDYINIYWNEIEKGKEFQFILRDTRILEPFDYDSIMMYGEDFFAKGTSRVMQAKDENIRIKGVNKVMGLSPTDIREINKLYKCNLTK